ncbi:MAG: YjgP/YjgQ family permease [Cytophagales bacterium]|nr:YjgP/YjgQ family permease [Cytophagales bacterium]
MKKIDKLVLRAFIGPFSITFVVVVFILLIQYMLKYIEDFVGKDLGFTVFAELLFYFSLNMTPVALPLAILLSTLMTFGNLAEHNELTAIKGAGISLIRALFPIFIVVLILTFGIFYFNDYIVPKANLKAYSLLFDIRQKKPTLNFKEGAFYNGLPGYSIKVSKKFPGGNALKGVMIYDHTSGRGNTNVILADSGYTYTIYNDRYLVLELFNGKSFNEIHEQNVAQPQQFVRNQFRQSKLIFSLASFDLERTKEELFKGNRMMNNISELNTYVDSSRREYDKLETKLSKNIAAYYHYLFSPLDSAKNESTYIKIKSTDRRFRDRQAGKYQTGFTPSDTFSRPGRQVAGRFHQSSKLKAALNKTSTDASRSGHPEQPVPGTRENPHILKKATNQARGVKSYIKANRQRLKNIDRDANYFEIEKWRKYTQSVACIIFFLIGAPLGAIIKKGGLGVPAIISIMFFMIFYVLSIIGEKWAKEGIILIPYGMWAADFILLPIGLFFLRQAKNDSRLFQTDAWAVLWQKIRPGRKT